MATPYNIPTIIGVADVCQYLAQNAISKGTLFPNNPFDKDLPQKIYVENDSLRYLYDSDPTNIYLDEVANYVWALCVYTSKAYNIYASGNGGTIVPIVPGTHLPLPYDFEVNTSTSFIINGVSSTTITAFIGYNIEFVRGGITQNTTDTGGSYYTWDRDTGLFVTFPSATTSELFRISPIG
jgi:hypothetical protein